VRANVCFAALITSRLGWSRASVSPISSVYSAALA
jgi:hypothetical protein